MLIRVDLHNHEVHSRQAGCIHIHRQPPKSLQHWDVRFLLTPVLHASTEQCLSEMLQHMNERFLLMTVLFFSLLPNLLDQHRQLLELIILIKLTVNAPLEFSGIYILQHLRSPGLQHLNSLALKPLAKCSGWQDGYSQNSVSQSVFSANWSWQTSDRLRNFFTEPVILKGKLS